MRLAFLLASCVCGESLIEWVSIVPGFLVERTAWSQSESSHLSATLLPPQTCHKAGKATLVCESLNWGRGGELQFTTVYDIGPKFTSITMNLRNYEPMIHGVNTTLTVVFSDLGRRFSVLGKPCRPPAKDSATIDGTRVHSVSKSNVYFSSTYSQLDFESFENCVAYELIHRAQCPSSFTLSITVDTHKRAPIGCKW